MYTTPHVKPKHVTVSQWKFWKCVKHGCTESMTWYNVQIVKKKRRYVSIDVFV